MDKLPKRDAIRRTEQNLRALLQEIFASFNLLTFEELIDRLIQCIDVHVDLLVYIREKARFSDRLLSPEHHFLKFSFLAFSWERKKVSRFDGPKELTAKEHSLQNQGYLIRESELCRVYFRADRPLELERCLNLIMRIVVAFYINSGSLSHFRESVSARFTSDFFRQNPDGTIHDLVAFVERLTELKLTLWHQKDEMFFRSKRSYAAEDLLMPFPNFHCEYPSFQHDEKFLGDLRTSVLRRNQTFGASEDGQQHYVIRTFSGVHFAREDTTRWGNFHTRQKAVAIYTSRADDGRIHLDEIEYANSLISKYLAATDELQQSDIVTHAERRCFLVETAIAESPLATRSDIANSFVKVVDEAFHEVLRLTFADRLILWQFNQFSNTLEPIIDTSASGMLRPPAISLNVETNTNQLAVQVFKSGQQETLAHPLWITTEISQLDHLRANLPDDRTGKMQRLQGLKERRERMMNTGPKDSSSAFATPVRRGNIVIGVLEAASESAGRLTYDTQTFDRLASICGDAMRRLEMANDRAWLSRMSFVHAARHRIEELLREVEARAGDVGRELVEMIKTAQVARAEHMADDGERASQRILLALSKCDSDARVATWFEGFKRLRDLYSFSPMMAGVLADTIETLVENRSHGNFSIDDLTLSVQETSAPSNYTVILQFLPGDAWLEENKMERIAVSPIPSKSSLTFHYGLFLLSSQIRMVGGIVETMRDVDEIGSSAFGICFKLPAI